MMTVGSRVKVNVGLLYAGIPALEGTSNDDLTNKVEVKIVNYRGEGGWPVARLTGQPGSVASMLARWNGDE